MVPQTTMTRTSFVRFSIAAIAFALVCLTSEQASALPYTGPASYQAWGRAELEDGRIAYLQTDWGNAASVDAVDPPGDDAAGWLHLFEANGEDKVCDAPVHGAHVVVAPASARLQGRTPAGVGDCADLDVQVTWTAEEVRQPWFGHGWWGATCDGLPVYAVYERDGSNAAMSGNVGNAAMVSTRYAWIDQMLFLSTCREWLP